MSHLGDSICFQKTLCETWCMSGHAVVTKLPVTHCILRKAFWIIRVVSTDECSSLPQILMQIHCSTRSIIVNVTATQYTRSLNGVYRPHWLVQWSRHCSHTHIPVHSPWLPGYIDVTQTIIILTMAQLFLDRPCISKYGNTQQWVTQMGG